MVNGCTAELSASPLGGGITVTQRLKERELHSERMAAAAATHRRDGLRAAASRGGGLAGADGDGAGHRCGHGRGLQGSRRT